MSDAPIEPQSETVVPNVEEFFGHQPRPSDPGISTVSYCATCGMLVVQGLGGWQHGEEAP